MNQETMIVLANLDYLQVHFNARLDFAAGAIMLDEEPMFLVADLVYEGLTPATVPALFVLPQPADLIGKVVHLRIPRRS
jgi:hypothetical protein